MSENTIPQHTPLWHHKSPFWQQQQNSPAFVLYIWTRIKTPSVMNPKVKSFLYMGYRCYNVL